MSGTDGVVPLAVEPGWSAFDAGQFLVADLDAGIVVARCPTRLGPSSPLWVVVLPIRLTIDLVAGQRPAAPVLA